MRRMGLGAKIRLWIVAQVVVTVAMALGISACRKENNDAGNVASAKNGEAPSATRQAEPVTAGTTTTAEPDRRVLCSNSMYQTEFYGDVRIIRLTEESDHRLVDEVVRKKNDALKDISDLTSLETLWFQNVPISDLSPLSSLTKMKKLILISMGADTYIPQYSNRIVSIAPLAGMTDMEELSLQGNPISDISPLAGMTSLTSLNLYRTRVSDISALKGLTNLTFLHLGETGVSDISVLNGMTQLRALNLAHTGVSDISALKGKILLSLDVTGTKVSAEDCEALKRDLPSYAMPMFQIDGP